MEQKIPPLFIRARTAARRAPPRVISAVIPVAIPAAVFLILLAAWEYAIRASLIPAFLAPAPSAIAREFFASFPLIASNALITFGIALAGLCIAVALGIALAFLMDACAPLKRTAYPVALALQALPALVFAPMLVVWFGYGPASQLVMVIGLCFFPVLLTVMRAFDDISPAQITLLQSMGATNAQIARRVKFPNALFSMWSGLRLTVIYAVTASVISEWVGSVRGLGVLVIASQKSFNIERVFAINALIVLLSLALYRAVVVSEAWFMPWKKFEAKKAARQSAGKSVA